MPSDKPYHCSRANFRLAEHPRTGLVCGLLSVIDTDLRGYLLDQKTKYSQYAGTCSSIAGISRTS
jgi:hypothetical protein